MGLWTSNKRFLELASEKQALLGALEEGVLVVDEEMTITDVSSSALQLLQKRKQDLLGKRLSPLLQEKFFPLLQKMESLIEKCQETGIPMTDSILFEEKTKVYLELIAVPKVSGALIIFQDKSSHYKVVEMGKTFVANASHELKTPITIIKGFAETLQDMEDLPREVYLEIIEKIVRNCDRMEKLVNNLLLLADLERLPLSRYETCDLKELLIECVQLQKTLHPQAIFEVSVPSHALPILADRDLLDLALMNLLENAVRYSDKKVHIQVSLDFNEHEALIEIKDQGVGIPLEALEHIFERFYRVNKAHTRRLGGSGLGLSIVKHIIEKHQGNIRAESVLGEGSTFFLSFPLL